jgi:WhiB family redox-sensing transcriptional regulator
MTAPVDRRQWPRAPRHAVTEADTRVCERCGEEFRRPATIKRTQFALRRYCSPECRVIALYGHIAQPAPSSPATDAPALSDEWKWLGACQSESNKDLWHVNTRTEKDDAAEAKRICAICPVAQQCLDYAMATKERWGIWGGLDRHQRDALRRRNIRAGEVVT